MAVNLAAPTRPEAVRISGGCRGLQPQPIGMGGRPLGPAHQAWRGWEGGGGGGGGRGGGGGGGEAAKLCDAA